MSDSYHIDLQNLANTERQLAGRIDRLCSQLDRVEDFDEEQRGEVYAILQALKHEAQSTVEQVALFLSQSGGQGRV